MGRGNLLINNLRLELPPCREEIGTTYDSTGYRYCDRNNQFLVQNVVKKPGCETFEIDFGNSGGGVIGKKPELSKKTVPSKIVPRKISLDRLPSSARIMSRRPLKKVEKDERNQAIRRISAENYRNYTRPHSVGRCVDRRKTITKSSHGPGSCVAVLCISYIVFWR